jgi:nicotinamide-nucleotide amidase
MVPEGADVLMNRWGTAPGVHLDDGGTHWFMLPGVPREMKNLMGDAVLPRLEGTTRGSAVVRRELHVVGIAESNLMDQIADIAGIEQVASLPDARGEVSLRITFSADLRDEAEAECRAIETRLRARLGTAVYGTDEESLESVVGGLLLRERMSIAVAESCTGGLVTSRLTDVPGSSAYVLASIVAYSNEAKQQLLGVPGATLRAFGAVSEETAAAMATGVRKLVQASLGLSITGIAGPSGGSSLKPVGLVYIAVADQRGTSVSQHLFGDDRLLTKQRAAQIALDTVRRRIMARGD